VFYPGLNGSRCYRIPTVIRTHRGTLLAFAENRIDGCEDNGPHHQLVLRRSSDLGRTWGPMILVADGHRPCAGCPAAISNPNPVEVLLENGSRAVLLHYDTMNNPHPAAHGLDVQTWSLDDGLTWHGSEVLSYPPEQNQGSLIGPSVGLQDARGVIYFSANRVNGSGHFLYHSADGGRSWAASEPIPVSGECSIAFLVSPLDGRILVNCRTGRGHRAQVVMSANGTAAGEVFWPTELVDPGCQGSIINEGGVLYFSNANTRHHRSNMTVKRSVDRGLTWNSGVLVWDGPSGYSQLVPLGMSTDIGLLFESKKKGNNTDMVLSFVRVTIEAERSLVLI
jgi:sialidase-1